MDEFLLGSFDETEWRTPMAIFKRNEFHDEVLPVSGDVVCIDRLLQWLDHDNAEPVFELRRVKGQNPIMSMSFRLTPFGRGVLHEGLPSIGAAPPVFIGGCKVYSADAPFVCARERGQTRIVPL
jgi:hypothetical protein